jgi:putative flippase GtrA
VWRLCAFVEVSRAGWGFIAGSPEVTTLKAIANGQFVRFLAVGSLNTLFGYGVFSLLVVAELVPGVALLIATVLGVLFNYFTTGRIVFATQGLGRLPWFVGAYSLTFLFNLLSLRGLISVGLSPLLAQALLLPVVTVTNFALNKLLVFRGAQ